MSRWLPVLLVMLVGCGGGQPSTSEWVDEVWAPMRDSVPAPDAATPESCDEALGTIRSRSERIRPAPDVELGDATREWVRRAENLLFDCAAGNAPDYPARFDELGRQRGQVESLLVNPSPGSRAGG